MEQFSLVKAPREEILRFVEEKVELDPGFREFVRFCNSANIQLEIVSEGLDFYINHVLNHAGLSVPVKTNTAIFSDKGIEIEFPYAPVSCEECGRCGNCKIEHVKRWQERGYRVAFVGEGHSDFFACRHADLVLAKGYLSEFCEQKGIPYKLYQNFEDVRRAIEEWVGNL